MRCTPCCCLTFLATITLGLTTSVIQAAETQPNTLTSAEQAEGWQLLFDGKTTDGWRNFRSDKAGEGWKVVDGALTRSAANAGDIMTDQQYDAFELSLEYKIFKEGNSGLMFHVTEEEDTPWKTGPEIQIQDNVDGHDPELSGWLYQLYHPDVDATKPVGEWNQLRVLITPTKSATFMNGVKYYEFVKGSDEWNQRVAESKFRSMPKFGKATKGHIALQDHGNPVAFRNIKIRVIKAD